MFNSTLECLLTLEDYYILQNNYLNEIITNDTRSTLAVWMLEVCEQENCTNQIFYLSMNLFDRFMQSVKNSRLLINKSYLQLIGSTCLFLSSKLRNSSPLESLKLIDYTDNSIQLIDMLELELLILQKLRYDTDCICPNDYLDIYLEQMQLDHINNLEKLKRHFYAFTALCSTEIQFSFYPASMIAYACLMCALNGLQLNNVNKIDSRLRNTNLFKLLNNYIQIDMDCLQLLTDQVNLLLGKSASNTVDYKQSDTNEKENKKRSSTCSSISSSCSLMDFNEYTNSSSYCLTPPLANQLPLPNF